jgi:hypothetical protein
MIVSSHHLYVIISNKCFSLPLFIFVLHEGLTSKPAASLTTPQHPGSFAFNIIWRYATHSCHSHGVDFSPIGIFQLVGLHAGYSYCIELSTPNPTHMKTFAIEL